MHVISENFVRKSVLKIGGVTKASNLLGVSNGAVHSWIKKRRITNIDYARQISELSGISIEKVRPC